ncbi:MAG: hypothetical protein HY850_07370 [Betaproteobacteria bacterium]|nr:hypothetical protein [Betaproteobacteria bacterium]
MKPSPRRMRGFVMIYALGVLIFITVIALSLAYVLRLDAKLVNHQRGAVKTEQALRGALHYTLAELAKARALQPLLASGQTVKTPPWSAEAGPYQVQFEDLDITIDFARVNPDINLVTREVLARLLLYLGAQNMEEALHYADIVIGARDKIDPSEVAKQAAATHPAGAQPGGANPPAAAPPPSGGAPQAGMPAPSAKPAVPGVQPPAAKGFSRIEEVLALEAIPLPLRNGTQPAKKKDGDTEAEAPKPGLAQLFSVGTGMRGLDVNRADLALVAAYGNAPLDKLIEFDRKRRQKPLSPDEGAALLGDGAKDIFAKADSATVQLKLISTNPLYPAVAEAVIEPGAAPAPGRILRFSMQPLFGPGIHALQGTGLLHNPLWERPPGREGAVGKSPGRVRPGDGPPTQFLVGMASMPLVYPGRELARSSDSRP